MHIFVRPYSLLLAGHFQLQSKKKASLQPLLALLRVVVAAVDTGRRRLHKLGNEVDRNRKNDGRVLLCRDGTESLESPMSSTQYIVYIILWYKLKRQRKQQKNPTFLPEFLTPNSCFLRQQEKTSILRFLNLNTCTAIARPSPFQHKKAKISSF